MASAILAAMHAGPEARLRFSALVAALGAVVVTSLTSGASAQMPVTGPPPAPETAEQGARKHFESALELYRAGDYAPALNELEQAAALDPNGKDLFFNLALVHEKLGQLDEAVAALERFRALESDPTERQRAQVSIDRLRGAERAAATRAPSPAPCPEPPPVPTPARPTAVLIGAASMAVVSLVVGTVFGIKALSDDVSNEATSSTLSVEQLRERARRAEREALIADVAFALSAVSAGTFVGVWVLAPGEPARQSAGLTLRGTF